MPKYEKLDYWSLKAQKEGYPARSVYKLQEIDRKYRLFNKNPCRVLDLGAAPGSWSLYLLRNLAGLSLTAVDLSPLSRRFDRGLFEGENFRFIQGDMTAPEVRAAAIEGGPFDVIVCDAAPLTTGNRSVDTASSLELGENAIDYAVRALKKGGGLVFKIFQGEGSAALLGRLRGLFAAAKCFKPEVCRPNSFEAYYVGIGKNV
jgi:23S rRNA (uridine2552-2'-O)-methyltransferase